MPSENTKILDFLHYQKSGKAPFIIQDLGCLIEKTDGCKNLSTTKVGEHIPSVFSMSIILSFKSIENNYDVYKGKDCMEQLCEFLREHAMEIEENEVINKRTVEII